MLARRDARQHRQHDLLDRHRERPVVSFTVVTPGPVKMSSQVLRVFELGVSAVMETLAARQWAVLEADEVRAPTGPEWLASVAAPPMALKRALVELEATLSMGRLWDVDVLTIDGPLSRTSLGCDARRCLVCERPAHACARSRAHGLEEVLDAWGRIAGSTVAVDAWTLSPPASARSIGALAADALRIEARLTPKPGLVDAANNGAHRDLDLATMLASADALEPFFVAMGECDAEVGELRRLGLAAEQAMWAATDGANAHQGAIFSLGLLSAAWSTGAETVGSLCAQAGRLAREIAALQGHLRSTRASASALGLGGARAEAASGFVTVRRSSLPVVHFRRLSGWDDSSALLAALVALMAVNADTNLVHRGGPRALEVVQRWASIVEAGVVEPEHLRTVLTAADAGFCARNWSPGGSADLVAVTQFLDALRSESRD